MLRDGNEKENYNTAMHFYICNWKVDMKKISAYSPLEFLTMALKPNE